MYVSRILESKGNDVMTIDAQTTVYDALKKMADLNIGSLVVTDDVGIMGIFSERDYARKGILQGQPSKETPVAAMVHTNYCTLSLKTSLHECMALMTERRLHHMPVIENNQLLGIVSIGDVVKQIISEQDFTIKELEKYILGHPVDLDVAQRLY